MWLVGMRDFMGSVQWSGIWLCVGLASPFQSGAIGTQQPAEDIAAPPSTQELAEVIVTANKREQNLQDVGHAVTAIGGDVLAGQRITDVADLAKFVPGLQASPSLNNTPVYTLRGIGFYETSVAAYPDVSIYLDQAPLPLSVMSKLTIFDLQRVEVLKGPQGTLFGNNATGGAINFVAAKPTPAFDAGADVSFSRFHTLAVDGFVSGPITPALDARLAVKVVEGGDWQYSYARDDSLGSTREAAFRLTLAWQAAAGLVVLVNANGWQDRSDPPAPQLARRSTPADLQAPLGTVGPTGAIGPNFPILFYPPAPHDDRAADWSADNRPYADDRLSQVSMSVAYRLAPGLSLTSISNVVRYRMQNATDGDGTALNDLDITSDHADATTFTQEMRVAGDSPGTPLRWVIGVNYERTHVDESASLIDPDAATGAQQGFSADSYESDQHMSNSAAFANVDFDLSRRFTMNVGLRYTQADRSTSSGTYPTPGYIEPFPGSPGLLNLLNFVWADVYTPLFCPGVRFVPLVPGESVSINPRTCETGRYRAVIDQSNVSWSAGTTFKATPDLMLYLDAAKGFKAGSFPEVSAATTSQYAAVTQESVLSYEAGIKSKLASGRITLNGDVFFYDYRDKQLRGKTVDPIFGLLDTLVNVPKSQLAGAEIDFHVLPLAGLELRLAATYLDSKVEQYDGTIGITRQNGLAFPVRASFRGVSLPFAPRFQASTAADYLFPLGALHLGFVGASIAAQSSSIGSLQLSSRDVADATIDPHGTLDLRAGIGSSDNRWKMTLWGTNVTDRYYWTNALRVYDTVVRYAGRPAEYGISLDWRW
jgi:outer membrane receptor protein involved in Fe transport